MMAKLIEQEAKLENER
jgi:hypothetical protein